MAGTRFGDKGVAIERLDVSAYTVPTDFPESDGTIKWDKTTLVLVQATAGGKRSVGYSYALWSCRYRQCTCYHYVCCPGRLSIG